MKKKKKTSKNTISHGLFKLLIRNNYIIKTNFSQGFFQVKNYPDNVKRWRRKKKLNEFLMEKLFYFFAESEKFYNYRQFFISVAWLVLLLLSWILFLNVSLNIKKKKKIFRFWNGWSKCNIFFFGKIHKMLIIFNLIFFNAAQSSSTNNLFL